MTLENSILEFIKDNNEKNKDVDSVDIVVKFREKADPNVILKKVGKLQEEGKIQRKYLESKYGFIVTDKDRILQ